MSNTNMNTTEEHEISRKGGGMDKLKQSLPPEFDELNIPTDGNKGQASMPKKYIFKKHRNRPISEPKYETGFQGQYTDSEGYIFDLGTRAFNKFSRKMKEL